MPRYRVHFTHHDGVSTTGDHVSEREVAIDEVIVVGGERWHVHEVEPLEIEDYDGLLAVAPVANET